MVDATDSTHQRNSLEDEVAVLAGVGPGRAARLQVMGVHTLGDLLTTYPIRYMDLSSESKISDLRVGQMASVRGVVKELSVPPVRRGKVAVVTVAIYDTTGVLWGVWFNQRHVTASMSIGDEIVLSGKIVFKFGRLQIEGPAWELLRDDSSEGLHTRGIIPVHPCTKGLTTRAIRGWVYQALELVSDSDIDRFDPVPSPISNRRNLVSRSQALRDIHFPRDINALKRARGRVKYEELLVLQTAVQRRKAMVGADSPSLHTYTGDSISEMGTQMGITPTVDQEDATKQIIDDMRSPSPMRRLLQGDVGSGKTFVAASALLHALASGGQTAIMAPTESLAIQLHGKLGVILEHLGHSSALLTGSTSTADRKLILSGLRSGEVHSVVGTHALIQKDVRFNRLTFVVIDEQHRFGVDQRDALVGKAAAVDMLVMTATPIPRTLALTVYGDLEITTLMNPPKGRPRTLTQVISHTELPSVYSELQRRVKAGEQGYIVYPLIDKGESIDAPSLDAEYQTIKDEHLVDTRVGMLHGRLKSEVKSGVLREFQSGSVQVLVSTTVIEVGIDVPAATVMIIRGPDRYGLSQLHQLRGRIGRGDKPSICFVVDDGKSTEVAERLHLFASVTSGFELAELDLETRGEGDILGVKQSGFGALSLVRLPKDMTILEQARDDAMQIVKENPSLNRGANRHLGRLARAAFNYGSGA